MKIIVSILFIFSLNAYSREILVGFFSLPPHAYIDQQTKKANGYAIDYFDKLSFLPKDSKFRFIQLPLPRLLKMVEDNEIDIVLYLAKNKEREAIAKFPSLPFYQMKSAIAVKNNTYKNDDISLDELRKLRIGVWADGFYPEYLSSFKLAKLTGLDVYRRSIEKILSGRMDAFYNPDSLNLIYSVKEVDKQKELKIVTLNTPSIGLYTVFSKKFTQDYPIDLYMKALATQNKIESYSKFIQKFK